MLEIRKSLSKLALLVALGAFALPTGTGAADHNDPNAINSIFAGVNVSAADLYDLFGWPADDTSRGERVVLALTFASIPKTGELDEDLLYRIRLYAAPRASFDLNEGHGVEAMLRHFEGLKERYLHVKPAEVRVWPAGAGKATIRFKGFAGADLEQTIETNKSLELKTSDGHAISVYVGGRDDAFFNDLPGFFRSINYAPQFYHVPLDQPRAMRELPIPKTLIELEGNTLFNFDPARPRHGSGVKLDLPPGPYEWKGNAFKKDANGNFRFVYSGQDAQAGMNVNAVIVEVPLAYVTRDSATDRIVNAWGESWVRKASGKAAPIPDDRVLPGPVWEQHPYITATVIVLVGIALFWLARRVVLRPWARKTLRVVGALLAVSGAGYAIIVVMGLGFAGSRGQTLHDAQLRGYKLVDTDGQAFADAALNQRDDERQLGADNIALGPSFITRLGHLGWGFGPSIRALGLKSAFDDDNSPVPVHRTPSGPIEAFPRVKKMLFQKLNMPDDSWNRKKLNIPLRRTFEVFVPNVNSIDMDTTGTWPFGRRPEDQVATRFLALFLDMSAKTGQGKPYDIELLNQPALWAAAPIEPKTVPNPPANDKPFLPQFPYLAEPWPR